MSKVNAVVIDEMNVDSYRDSDEQNPRKDCEMCGRQFISKIGEVYCETCSKEFDEMGDNSELNGIVARRGINWVKDFVEKLETEWIPCHECGLPFSKKELHKKRIYEGTDFKENSPINYPVALVCNKCR